MGEPYFALDAPDIREMSHCVFEGLHFTAKEKDKNV
jgi:hypothetical protein